MQLVQLIEYPKEILTLSGIWPDKNLSAFQRFKAYTTVTFNGLLCICMFINVGYNCQNFLTISKSLYLTMAVLCAVTKEIVLVLKSDSFQKLIDMIESPRFNNYLTINSDDFKNYWKTLRVLTICFKIEVIGCLVGMTLFPVMEHKPLPIDFPFFNNDSYRYPFYTFEMVSVSIAAYHNMLIDLLATGIFAIAAVQLKILNKKLAETNSNVRKMSKYSEKAKEECTYNYLKECCIHYSAIEEYVRQIVRVFSVIFFLQLGTCSIAICNAGILILSVSPVSIEAFSLYFYLAAVLLQPGLYCWFGNDVYLESLEVNNACYMWKWYENGATVRKAIFILMERTKRPLEIRGLNFVTLSLNTYISILKWSYSYFTVLLHITVKKGE